MIDGIPNRPLYFYQKEIIAYHITCYYIVCHLLLQLCNPSYANNPLANDFPRISSSSPLYSHYIPKIVGLNNRSITFTWLLVKFHIQSQHTQQYINHNPYTEKTNPPLHPFANSNSLRWTTALCPHTFWPTRTATAAPSRTWPPRAGTTTCRCSGAGEAGKWEGWWS